MLKAKQSLLPNDSPWQAMDARPGVDSPGQEASARLPLAGSAGWLLRALSDLASKPHADGIKASHSPSQQISRQRSVARLLPLSPLGVGFLVRSLSKP